MMENRSFDHLLGLAARRRRAAGRAAATRTARRRRSRRTPLAAGLPGLRPPRSRPLVRGRARRVRRRRVRRLAARRDERRLRHRLLPAAATWRSSGRRRRSWTALRPLLRRHHGGDVPEPHLPARRPDRPPHQHARPISDAADDLGPPRGRRARRAATTSATCRSWRCGARSTCRSAARHAAFCRDALPGTLPAVVVRRSAASSTRSSGTSGRRPPARRHPQRRGVPEPHLHGGDAQPGLVAHTVLVINYDEWGGFFDHVPPPPRPIRATAEPPAPGRAARLPRAVPARLAVRAARPRRHGCSTTRRSSG